MKRRDFLKLGSVMSAISYASIGPMGNILNAPIETVAQGQIYRGTHDGQILTSRDGGKSWQLNSNFGPGYSVLDIFTARDGQVYLHMGFKHSNFHLVQSKDRTAWISQPFKTTPRPGV